MKGNYKFASIFLVLTLSACGEPVVPPGYFAELPSLPSVWEELLGPAHWRLVWINPEGVKETLEFAGPPGGVKPEITLAGMWATAILAFPYWPEQGILPEMMHPAGGIFPFDAEGPLIRLSWRGGVDAWFYRELSIATAGEGAETGKRRPEYFDWPRFRSLLDSSVIDETVRADPWRADWGDIALRTIRSGFDRRRLKAQAGEEFLLPRSALGGAPGLEGPLAGPSPFAKPLFPEPDTGFRFTLTGQTDTYVSPAGILRINRGAWMWQPGKSPAKLPEAGYPASGDIQAKILL
jgi:hypothetical protein